jgi:hypothetical protein
LDIVVGEGSAIFELLASEDESLLVRRDTFFVLDFALHIVDGIAGLDLESDGLSSESLDNYKILVTNSDNKLLAELTDLHATTETEDQVKGGLLLDIVIAQGTAILELLASEDKALLIGRNAFFILDLALDIVDGIAGLDLKSDGLAGD